MYNGLERKKLLELWATNCRRCQMAHYMLANEYSRKKFYLGIPTVILSAIVGTGVIVSISQDIPVFGKLIGGVISMIIAILTALQTFLTCGENSMLHKFSGSNYEILKRKIQTELAISDKDGVVEDEVIIDLQNCMDMLSKEAPEISEKIWEKVLKAVPPQKHLWVHSNVSKNH